MIRLAVAAPCKKRCGIADYAQLLAEALPCDFRIQWIDLPTSASSERWEDAACEAESADLVHVHYETDLFAPVKPYRNRFTSLLKKLHPPIVVTLHDHLPELKPRWTTKKPYRMDDLIRDLAYLPFFKNWEAHLYRQAAHWIVHSEELAAHLSHFLGPERISLFPMPIPSSRIHWDPEKVTRYRLITPGFIKPHKGYEDLLEVLVARHGWKWVIAGGPQDRNDEEYVRALRKEIDRLELDEQIEITGYLSRDAMEEQLSRAMLAVFPYHRTAGSASLAWAVSVGVPAVTSDLPAFRSMKQTGAGIELLPLGGNASWAETIEKRIEDPHGLQALSRKNTDYADLNSFAEIGKRMAKLFRALLI